jgi:hypothetical protein
VEKIPAYAAIKIFLSCKNRSSVARKKRQNLFKYRNEEGKEEEEEGMKNSTIFSYLSNFVSGLPMRL